MKHIRNFCIIAHIDHGKSTLAEEYILNLIDTPGHVDFSYEVSRSIAACEGALLVVDAAQSIQAQTISNLYLALENDLEIIPVLNKVDLPSANPEEVTDDIVFDSVYNPFRGVETYFRVINGEIKKGQKIKFVATNKDYFADEVGTLKLTQEIKQSVKAGDVGYLITGIKDAREVKVGDTITDAAKPTENAIEGFEDVKPMVFAGIYPVDTDDRDAAHGNYSRAFRT